MIKSIAIVSLFALPIISSIVLTIIYGTEYNEIERKVLTILLIIFATIDASLLCLIKIRKPYLKDDYINFHKRHGFIKIICLKFIGVFLFLNLYPVPGFRTTLLVLVLGYGLVITVMVYEFIKERSIISQEEKEGEHNHLMERNAE
jgi:amino acid transporter